MTILVSGATGNIGRHLVKQLVESGHSVRALTRDPSKANIPAELADRVELAAGNLARPDTLTDALRGVTAWHLLTSDGADGAPLPNGADLAAAATKAGVQRVSLVWSGYPSAVEAAFEASDLEWTQLQPQEFMSNALNWIDSVRDSDTVVASFPEVRSAVIHEADIAAVSAAVMTDSGHAGKKYNLTGPTAFTLPQRIEILSAALGRELRFVERSREEELQLMLNRDVPMETAEYVIGWHADPPTEAYTPVSTVEQVTGRPSRTFEMWAAENAAKFNR